MARSIFVLWFNKRSFLALAEAELYVYKQNEHNEACLFFYRNLRSTWKIVIYLVYVYFKQWLIAIIKNLQIIKINCR